MKLKSFVYTGITAVLFFSCQSNEKKTEVTENFSDPLLTNRDTAIDPAIDFFHYANGGWFKRNPIPESERSNGIFKIIDDTIFNQVKRICETASLETNVTAGSNKQKIGDFYASGMDTATIEKTGISCLDMEMNRIDGASDIKSLLSVIGYLHTIGCNPAFSFSVTQDDKISSKYALTFAQGGLGLGQRDYYFNSDERTKNIRSEYVKHIAKMLTLSGDDESISQKNSETIMKIETDLATYSRKLEDMRDPVKNYNKMSLQQFNALCPNIDWNNVLEEMGVKNADSVIIGQPEFFTGFNSLLKKYSVNEWRVYVKWDLLNNYAPYLNKAIEEQNFKFNSTVLLGITAQKPRWKRIVEQTNKSLGELIGQVYVAEYLPKGSKEKLLEIGNNIRDVYAVHIKNLDWMSEATKQKALKKLSGIVMKVGYPDKWKDMSMTKFDRSSYCANVKEASRWNYFYNTNHYGQPVDRNEWRMFPQTYNAYYNPSNNEIVVPACNIIVPGFEGRMPDDAILYGIIGGSTFGHEITHGFDDSGSQYDENGNLNNWWTKEDKEKFVAKTKLIVEQFNNYRVLDSVRLNGDATQGENIADLGGIVMGYEAFKKTSQFSNNEMISGLSPDQRFFLAYAYAWMVNIKPASLARQVMIDVHAPAQFRVNGPLSNQAEFQKTFGIKKGDPMFRSDSLMVKIW